MDQIHKDFYPAAKSNRQAGGEPKLTGLSLCLRYVQCFFQLCGILLYTFYCSLEFIYTQIFPPQPKNLKTNEIILVTGGGNGIGREICIQLAKKAGKAVTIITWDVDEEGNAGVVKELKALGIEKAYAFKVDVSNQEQVSATAEKIRQEIGHVTLLFNNAGVPGLPGNAWEIEPKVVQKVYEINAISHCWTLREFLPAMIEKGEGHVVETCSVLGFISGRSGSPYIASKHAVKGYVESVKEDLRFLKSKPDIKFSLVYPHNTLSAMTANVNFKSEKYPFLIPKMTPRYVASKIIEGMERNEEHIYVPGDMRFISMIMPLLPPKVFRKVTDVFDVQMD